MSCTYLFRGARPAPLWHRALCAECRKDKRADSLIAFALTCRKAEPAPLSVLARTLGALELPHSLPRPRRERFAAFGRRARTPIALGIGGIALAGYGWTRYIDLDPSLAVPTPTISGPNAFEDLQNAAMLLKEVDNVSYMLFPSRRRNEQVMLAPASGGSILGVASDSTSGGASPGVTAAYTLGEKETVLRENQAALKALRGAFGNPYLAPPVRSLEWTMPYLAAYRSMARLLLLEAEIAEERKEWGRALNCRLDALELGTQVQQKGSLLAKLVGNACQAIGRKRIWPLVSKLSAAEAREGAARLRAILADSVPLSETLLEEESYMLAGLQEAMRKPGWRHRMMGNSVDEFGNPIESGPPPWLCYIMLLPHSKASILANASEYLNRQIARAREPYYPRPAELPRDDLDPISRRLMPAFDHARFQDTSTQAQNRLLLISLSLRAIRAERGTYPFRLVDVQSVDHELRIDPFGMGKRFKYTRGGDGYVLYSVGPDGRDDLGARLHNPFKSHREPQFLEPDSFGDIVPGRELENLD